MLGDIAETINTECKVSKPVTSEIYHILYNLLLYLKDYPLLIVVALILVLFEKTANIMLALSLREIIDALESPDKDVILGPITLVLLYGVLRLIGPAFAELRDVLFSQVSEKVSKRIGVRVLSHVLSLDAEYYTRTAVGSICRDLDRGIAGVSFLLRYMLFNGGPTLVEIVLILAVLAGAVRIEYAVIALVGVVAYLVISIAANEWRVKFVSQVNIHNSSANACATECIANFEVIKLHGSESFESTRYAGVMSAWELARITDRRTLSFVIIGQVLIIAVTISVMLLLGTHDYRDNELSVGGFVMLTALIAQLFAPLNLLGFVYREIRQALADVERMYVLLDEHPIVVDVLDSKKLKKPIKQIAFEHVWFEYTKGRPVLKDLTFSISAGEYVAFVGASGSGKSTIVRLIARLYDTNRGHVAFDGIDIRNLKQSSLRQCIGIVSQETMLFSASLADNIGYGAPDAGLEAIYEAALKAGLGKLMVRLPNGLDSHLGERGVKLSGGERQRVGIARALVRNPQVLVLDEATASLDYGTESKVLAALKTVKEGRTTIAIAHRLTSVIDADRIFVLHDGNLVDVGKHDELLKKGGLYSQLWHKQNKNHFSPKPTELK